MGIALFGALVLLPLYYQVARGEGPLAAGLLIVPQGLGVAIAMPIAGRITDRRGARAIVLPGVAVAAAGTFVYTQVSAHTPYALLATALAVRGLGLGSMMMPVTAAALVSLPREALARASRATVVIRQVSGSVGTALLAVLLARNIAGQLPAAAGGLGVLRSLAPSQQAQAAPMLASAFGETFWTAFALIAAVALPAALLPRRAVAAQ
jgi:MFS family permease